MYSNSVGICIKLLFYFSFFKQAFAFFVYFSLSMFVYVVRPEGFKYDLCENGTSIEDESGLCMTDIENTTLNAADVVTTLLKLPESDLTSQTKSPPDGKINKTLI